MNVRDVLAEGVLSGKGLVARYLAGFDDKTHTAQAPTLPNHVAWSLGHCALTMHRVADKLDGKGIPSTDFAAGATTGDLQRFGLEQVSFGSQPSANANEYPHIARCEGIFDTACERLAHAVRNASDEKLTARVPWGQGEIPMFVLVQRMLFHNGMHTGQIADLRRAFKMKSIFS